MTKILFNQFVEQKSVDVGLKTYMQKVYGYMSGGLLLTSLTAYLGTLPFFFKLFFRVSSNSISYSFLGWIALLAPLFILFPFNAAVMKNDGPKAKKLFWIFSGLMGISFSSVFMFFPAANIIQALLITGGMFAGMSLYGYTTGRDLTSMGSFMTMGLFGVILASLVNLFLQSAALNYGLSYLIVFIFLGLTAFDTQKIRSYYTRAGGNEALAVFGALALYLDFINIFRAILFLTDRR
ncbi:MAG: Bax inhibitor-1/YccA family protein [Alphaproteobacteria bacterium]|nr:Bax inhibitor-1/YccA family protein [Alphaproteobacteria bacterium]NCB50044.1 Bax inhibitor-1/YccA family protein [Alphaproteobacteria bacterium]